MTEEELKALEAEKAAAAEAKTAEEAKAKEADKKARENKFDELPDWAQEELRATRREAASYRTTANDLKEKLAAAGNSEEALKAAEAIVAENNALKERLELESAIVELGVPAEAKALLDPKASVADRAKALLALRGQGPTVIVDGDISSRRRNDTVERTNGAELWKNRQKNRR